MTTLHMETEPVRAAAGQLKQAAEEMRAQLQALNYSVQQVDWLGPARDELELEMEGLGRQFQAQLDAGLVLANRIEQEVSEWENASASFFEGGSSPLPVVPIIIGGTFVIGAVVGLYLNWWQNQTLKDLTRDEALKKLEDNLDNSQVGRDALQKARDLGVGFELSKTGSGTYYDPSPPPGTMYIDPSSQQDVAAAGYIHELTHAVQHAEGRFPDPNSVSKQEYVDACLKNEADAVIAGFGYEKQSFVLDKVSQPAFETAYWDTYNQKLKELAHTGTHLSQAEMEKIAFEAGREKVLDAFRDGTIKTSTTHQSYVDYYSGGWDRSVKKI